MGNSWILFRNRLFSMVSCACVRVGFGVFGRLSGSFWPVRRPRWKIGWRRSMTTYTRCSPGSIKFPRMTTSVKGKSFCVCVCVCFLPGYRFWCRYYFVQRNHEHQAAGIKVQTIVAIPLTTDAEWRYLLFYPRKFARAITLFADSTFLGDIAVSVGDRNTCRVS